VQIAQDTPCHEADLLCRARRGDRQAFDALARRYTGRIRATSHRILRNTADVEDNVQNVLFKAFLNLRNFHESSLLSTWLMRITINEALMKLRGSVAEKRRTVSADDPAASGAIHATANAVPVPMNPEARCIAQELVLKALKAVPRELRDPFVLFAVGGWTQKELSAMQGIALQTVKTRIFRARRKMREHLKTEEGSFATRPSLARDGQRLPEPRVSSGMGSCEHP
jgi:RNA polymerase sigma-70 factor, ECF subfamily